ncbi:MAG: DEAD/DEAH box helicase, partial [Thaumarchaeota archaeon]|nr:DEAD/DEAH box helicase [Nitrososphaerota archaeon]
MTILDEEAVLNMLIKPVAEAFKERFKHLTEPQIEAIPKILDGKNLLLMAPTGTGKTEAALLPILSKMILEGRKPGIKILYITPLRALNRDLLERIDWWAQRLDFRSAVRHGDTAQRERRTQSLEPPDLLITTPETLQVILTGKILRNHLRAVKWVIVDEVHELATDKRGAQLAVGLERLRRLTGSDFQRIGLSATIGEPEKIAAFLVGVNRECEIVRVPVAKSMEFRVVYPKPVEEDRVLAESLGVHPEVAARLRIIRELVERHRSTLIFTNTRPLAEILTNRFRVWDEQMQIGIHHGSLSKTKRLSAEDALKTGKLSGIVCTSSLELGIDVGRIDLVIQYNSPREVTRLIQRVGRSGHGIGRVAKGVVIAIDSDDALESIVIARRAREELLEEPEIPMKPYDVLMHQIAGLLIEYGRTSIDEALKLFKQTYNFKDLSEEELRAVAEHMANLGIAYLGDEVIAKPRNSRELYEYYFNNLSMIPEERQYIVIDEVKNEPVGILDEEFVAEYGEPGTRFILMGKAWEIHHLSGDRIYVAPLADYEGAVPSWVGEEIPVPYEVAEEVGALRREYRDKRRRGVSGNEIAEEIAGRYDADPEDVARAFKEVEQHIERGIPVPTDVDLLVEETGKHIVLHLHGGLKVNRTIQKLISYHLSEKIGAPIKGQQDPYRIAFRSPHISVDSIVASLKEVLNDFDEKLRRAIESSTLFKRRLVHVARKMGVIKYEANLSEINLNQLAEALKDTPVYRETMNYTLFHDFDAEKAREVLERIARGELRIHRWRSPSGEASPIARLTLSRFETESEVSSPQGMKRVVLMAVRGRLINESWLAVCTDCYEYYEQILVKDLPEKPKCPVCGSNMIGLTKRPLEEVLGLIARKGKPVNKKERRIIAELKRNAVLVSKYGKAAAIALSARGLSLKEVVRILEEEPHESMRLIELLVEAEKKALQRRLGLTK